MVLRSSLAWLLAISTFIVSNVIADSDWHSFWARNPDDANPIEDPPEGQPKNNAEFETMLRQDALTNSVSAFRSESIGAEGSTWYWFAFIDRDTVAEKYTDLAVLQVIVDINKVDTPKSPIEEPPARLRRRRGKHTKREITSQGDAPRQLRFLSLPERARNDLDTNTLYRYDETAGAGVRVYVVDTGLNFDSSEWQSEGGRSQPEMIFAGFATESERRDLDTRDGHGTCMADLAVGRINGVAKEADLTSVQVDDSTTEFKKKATFEAQLDGISRVADDIADKNLGDKAVVLMAFGIVPQLDAERDNAFEDAYFSVLEELDKRGVALVVAVPNDDKCDLWPCFWNNPENGFFIADMITVSSGLINDGSFGKTDTDDWVTLFGPGDDRRDGGKAQPGLSCADFVGDQNSPNGQSGTSHASAFVAGLMAYFKGTGLSNDDARKMLLDKRYKRRDDGPLMPWNGVEDII